MDLGHTSKPHNFFINPKRIATGESSGPFQMPDKSVEMNRIKASLVGWTIIACARFSLHMQGSECHPSMTSCRRIGGSSRRHASLVGLFNQVQTFALHELLLASWKGDTAVIAFEAQFQSPPAKRDWPGKRIAIAEPDFARRDQAHAENI